MNRNSQSTGLTIVWLAELHHIMFLNVRFVQNKYKHKEYLATQEIQHDFWHKGLTLWTSFARYISIRVSRTISSSWLWNNFIVIMANHFLRTNKQLCVCSVTMKTVRCCLPSWDLLGGNVFRSTRPVSNPICVLHQDVHVPLLVQDVLFWLKMHTHTHTHTHILKTHSPRALWLILSKTDKTYFVYSYMPCVCHGHRDLFWNQFVTPKKHTRQFGLQSALTDQKRKEVKKKSKSHC